MNSREMQSARWLSWAVVAAALIFAAAVRLRLLSIPLERDEGEYAYAGQLLLQGIPPYREAFNMKFPGVYAVYAGIMAIFGQSIEGIHLGFLICNALTIVLLFLLGRRLLGASGGAAAALVYAILSLSPGVLGMQAHATHFVVLAVVAGCFLLLRAIEGGGAGTLFASGVLFGIAVLMKQHGIFFAVFAGFYLLWEDRRQWRRVAILYAGVGLPLLVTGLALWRAGVFDRFWFWTFTYAREYVSETGLVAGFFNLLLSTIRVVARDFPLWLMAAAGLVVTVLRKENRRAFLVALLAFSFLAMAPGLYFREHYFVMILPAIALLAGVAMRAAQQALGNLAGAGVLAGAVATCLVLRGSVLFGLSPEEVSRKMYQPNPFVEAIPAAAYLRSHTIEGERIAVLGSEPEIYFYAGRRSVTGHIYTYGMMENQPYAFTMQEEMIRDIESGHPAYVVRVSVPQSWLAKPGSPSRIFDWWESYRQHYERVSDPNTDGGLEIYRWIR